MVLYSTEIAFRELSPYPNSFLECQHCNSFHQGEELILVQAVPRLDKVNCNVSRNIGILKMDLDTEITLETQFLYFNIINHTYILCQY